MTTATTATRDTESFGDIDQITFPNGTQVYYRDRDHSYWREAKRKGDGWSGSGRLTGVTTLCAPYDFRPDSLLRWVERLTLDGVVRGFNGQRVPSDPHILRQMLENKELRWEQIRDAAGQRGTNAHEIVFHKLALGEDPDLAELPEDQRGFGQGVFRWWLEREPEITHAEQVVASLTHGYAGTLDLRCKISDPLRPGYGIVDLKTSGFLSGKMCAQPLAYDLGGLHSGLWEEPAEWALIVQVDADGGYREVFLDGVSHDDFLLALSVYRREAEFKKIIRAQAA